MSTDKPNAAQPRANNAWEEAKRRVRDRNDQARSAAHREREAQERRIEASRRVRDLRNGVVR
jgi:hypothetical protein